MPFSWEADSVSIGQFVALLRLTAVAFRGS
jgi:hypothetical protein